MKYGFFAFIFAFLLTMIVYTIVKGWQVLTPVGSLKTVYAVLMVLLFTAFLTGMIFGNSFSPGVAKTVSFIGYSFLVLLVYLLISFLLTDIIRLINRFVPFINNMPDFRLWVFGISLAVIAVMMIIGNYKFNRPQTVYLEIESSKPLQHKEIKIVAVSDLHLGISIDKQRLRKYVAMINAQQPDIVLIAGDLIDRSILPVVNQKMDEELRQIKAPLGVFGINGNHEFFGEGAKQIIDFYRKSNIVLLQDSSGLVNNEFYIIGRDDKINVHRKTLNEITAGLDHSKPGILLDHQPSNLEDAEKNNIDLQLSGHTHNGQFFPGNLIVKSMFELGYGYLKKGNTHYYVSSGLALWGPQYRIGSQSEMVVIKFKY